MRRLLPLVLLGVAAAGCGGGSTTVTVTTTRTVTQTAPPPTGQTAVRVYFIRDGKVAPVERKVPKSAAVATAAMGELLAGPTDEEITEGYVSAVALGAKMQELEISGGVAHVTMDDAEGREALGQVVYTLTQFPTVGRVVVDGRSLTRAALEDVTPFILVESPLPHQAVSSPLRVTGTANTYEATFEYDLLAPGGRVISHHFETATSGSGTRGTFDFTIRFAAPNGLTRLVLYERSAQNGERLHVVPIPLTLAK